MGTRVPRVTPGRNPRGENVQSAKGQSTRSINDSFVMRVPRSQRRAWLRYPDESAPPATNAPKVLVSTNTTTASAATAASHWRFALRES